jgi:hypothetical protein
MAKKTDQVRARIVEAKKAEEDQPIVVQWAMSELGMPKGQATKYVRDLWDENKGVKVSVAKISDEPKAPKTSTNKEKTKTPQNLSEVLEILKSKGIEPIKNFDGGEIHTKDGTYSMYGKNVYFRTVSSTGEKTVEIFKTSELKDKIATLHIK